MIQTLKTARDFDEKTKFDRNEIDQKRNRTKNEKLFKLNKKFEKHF